MTPLPLLLRILADQQGVPAALLAEGGAVQASQLADLSGQIACLYRPGHADAALFEQHGWKALAQGALCQVDALLAADAIAPGATLVDGLWWRAAPAKPVGAQAASRALALQLVERVAADADTHEIEALLRQDPALSYQLLRLVNSIGVGSGRRITSFGQAILILGRQQLRRWLNLMLFAARDGDVRSAMLLARVAVRARLLELLAKLHGGDRLTQEQAFMTGMFSLLGVLFGMPMAQLLEPLSLGEAVHAALLDGQGELGALLALADCAERADLDGVSARLAALHLPVDGFNLAMAEANDWMLGALRDSRGGPRG